MEHRIMEHGIMELLNMEYGVSSQGVPNYNNSNGFEFVWLKLKQITLVRTRTWNIELWNYGTWKLGYSKIAYDCPILKIVKTQPDPSPTDNSNTNSNWWLTVGLDPIIALDHHHPPTHQELNVTNISAVTDLILTKL